jgi:hypothetical protein
MLRAIFLLLGSCLIMHTVYASGERTFRGRIISAETGLPIAATVSVTSGKGLDVKLDGEHEYVNYLGKKRWYVNGSFNVTTQEDSLYIEIRHGLETYPVNELVVLSDGVSEVKEFSLQRWINMANMGYYSGDTHVHFLETSSAHLQMQAEDLHIVNLLTSDFTYDKEIFTGKLDKVSTQEHLVYVGQEIRDWQLGHICFLGLKNIIEPYAPFGGQLNFMGSNNPHLLLSPRLKEAKEQQATSVWAHFSNLPGLESAIAIPLGLIDALELMTYDDPIKLPSHWTPWDYSGMSQTEFTVMRGMDLYYQYLNAGFMLPLTAGSDKMGEEIPVGSNRHYVYLKGEATYDNWIKGLRSGQGFISNSPMLTFRVDDHLAGESIIFDGEQTVKVHVEAKSLLPFGRLEIVVNGKVVVWEILPDYTTQREIYSLDLEVDVVLSESSWIAGRVTSQNTPGILPRGLTVFAHSNPIYFLQNEKPVRIEKSVEYLQTYQKAVRNWIELFSNFSSEAEKDEARMYLEEAERALKIKQ